MSDRKRRKDRPRRDRRAAGSQPDAFDPAPDLPPGEFLPAVDPVLLKQEKAKARELRDSSWWKRKRSAGLCYYCGQKFPPAELTMDHLIPLVRGGRSVKENLVPACKDCNNKKKYLLPTEWDEYLQSLVKHSES